MGQATDDSGHHGPAVPSTRPAEVADLPQVFWDTSSDLLVVTDGDGVLVACNPAWRRALGWPEAHRPDLGVVDLVHHDDRPVLLEALRSREPGRTIESLELRLRTTSGDHRQISWSGISDGSHWYAAGRDVTEHRRLEEEGRAQSAVFDDFDLAVVSVDVDARISRWSPGAERLYGWSAAEALGQPVAELMNPTPVDSAEVKGTVVDGRWESRTRSGEVRVAQVRWTELTDHDGQYAGTVSVGMDVTSQVLLERERRAVRQRLEAVTDSMSEGLFALAPDGGVILMNEAAESMLGWSWDEVRGQLLHDVTRHRGSIEGEHAATACPITGGCQLAGAESPALRRVDDDVFVRRDGSELEVSYTVTPLEHGEAEGGWVMVFRDATRMRAEQEQVRREIETRQRIRLVEAALEEDRLVLHAQPIVDLATGETVAHELLLRVVADDGSLSSPQEYLAIAEEHGLVGRIDRWVLRRAVDAAAAGRAVEVNVSAASIGDVDMLRDLERWLTESGADPSLLVLEITETAVIANDEAGRQFVETIHRLGCRVALDDFGTGYSGFAYLKQLDVDFVKIDIEFVRDVRSDVASRLVVEAVVTLAQGLGMTTVAEGVEDAETLELLVELGVDQAQGHHLGRPAPF